MTTRFDTVTIVGPGLMGTSLGLALKARGMAQRVRGVGRRQSTLDRALEAHGIDEASLELEPALRDADLVVVCTPAALVPEYLDRIRPICARGTVVTDVASTKQAICAHVRKAWAEPLHFVGSHPMCGSEKFGPEHADAALYEDAIVFVEAENGHLPEAHKSVIELWRGVGAKVIEVSPDLHDRLVARTSHVPHVVSAALAILSGTDDGIQPFVGSGFRDLTRLAEGRPEIWRDICLTNADAVSGSLRDLIHRLDEVAQAIEDGDAAALQTFFEQGRDARSKALDS